MRKTTHPIRDALEMAQAATIGTDIGRLALRQLARKYHAWIRAQEIALGTDMSPPDIGRLADELYRPTGRRLNVTMSAIPAEPA